MEVTFNYEERPSNLKPYFGVGENLERRVPMELEGVEGKNTVLMYFPESKKYESGETVVVSCLTIIPEIYKPIIKPGLHGQLWDLGFIAKTKILEVHHEAFPSS